MKKKLYYAKLDLGEEDILKIEVNNLYYLQDKVDELCCGNSLGKVYLFAAEDGSDFTFVTESHLVIQKLILSRKILKSTNVFYLFEFSSYEEAYNIALAMQEPNELCYSK